LRENKPDFTIDYDSDEDLSERKWEVGDRLDILKKMTG